jgi:ATP sulfurylase
LTNRLVTGKRAAHLAAEARGLPAVRLSPFELSDPEMLSIGGFSPLEGFMTRADYESVVRNMRLGNGLPWSLPITLAVTAEAAEQLRGQTRVALADGEGEPLAVLIVEDVFTYDREAEARAVFRTTETAYPGVAYLAPRGEWLISGVVEVFRRANNRAFAKYRLDPADTRRILAGRG